MNVLGRAFPSIYEKKFYRRICEILAFIIYALVLMLVFGLLSHTHNSGAYIGSDDSNLASKIKDNMKKDQNYGSTVLTISSDRVNDIKTALEEKDKGKLAELTAPVIEKAKEMNRLEAISVE